jgi:hypothetical protein
MKRLRIDVSRSPAELRKGLREIIRRRSDHFAVGRNALSVRFESAKGKRRRPGFSVRIDADGAVVSYTRPIDAFRALGRLMSGERSDFREDCAFDLLAVLIDCSRNGVLRVDRAQDLLCTLALMGFNAFVPYMEDTYEVPGEPFFGYLRGGYSQRELKQIDDFAAALGIEVFPCIQVLGHLEQLLQWPAYAHLRDVPGVLLADHPATYQLLKKMIRAATGPLRSKRIYATMDEAHGLGTGRYRAMFGPRDPFEILNRHMRRVVGICKKLGLRAMTSGDMYFRVGSNDNWYYDHKAVIPPRVARAIPKAMQLVYWDYYHTDAKFYEEWIDRHRRDLGKEPVISGGVWTWSHLWAALPFSFATTDALMKAAKRKGVRENICTLWGDDGMECDLMSALPGLQHYADHAYGDPDRRTTTANLRGSAGVDFDAFCLAADIDQLQGLSDPREMPGNCSKWLLWEDPMLALLTPQLGKHVPAAKKHYATLATKLSQFVPRGGMYRRLRFPSQVARVIALKVGLHPRIAAALRRRDRDELRRSLRSIFALQLAVESLWKLHRELWLDLYKPFGLEVLDGRYGRLRARLKTLYDRVKDYVDGRIDSIPELQVPLRKIYPTEDVYTLLDHARAATPSMIK